MKSTTSFFWRLHQVFFIYTLLVYGLAFFTFTGHWIAGFLMMSLPVLLLIHLVFFVFFALRKSSKIALSGAALLLSFPFWSRTFQFSWGAPPASEKQELTVLSYNVMSFDAYNFIQNIHPENNQAMLEWVKGLDTDIQCYQEFYNSDTRPHLNTLKQLKKAGYPYYTVLHPDIAPREQHCMGLAILSKYPIIDRGEVEFHDQNGLLFADIVVRKDTIRVINLHLRSMIVRFGGLKEAYLEKDYKQGKKEAKKVTQRLKMGFVHHSEEADVLLEWIRKSPHPVLVCGDFNEIPYGYVYGEVRSMLANAFEEKGHGFGFSYRNTPRFIRIDNQFFDKKKLEVIDFQTRRDIPYSDHYPVIGRYRLL